jgi:hypothetical protein
MPREKARPSLILNGRATPSRELRLVKDAIIQKMAGPLLAGGARSLQVTAIAVLNGRDHRWVEDYAEKEAKKLIAKIYAKAKRKKACSSGKTSRPHSKTARSRRG